MSWDYTKEGEDEGGQQTKRKFILNRPAPSGSPSAPSPAFSFADMRMDGFSRQFHVGGGSQGGGVLGVYHGGGDMNAWGGRQMGGTEFSRSRQSCQSEYESERVRDFLRIRIRRIRMRTNGFGSSVLSLILNFEPVIKEKSVPFIEEI
jgi:hypothetical protein